MLTETERLILTELTEDMAQALHENSLDGDVGRFVPDEVFGTVEEALQTIEFLRLQYGKTEGPLVYAVILKEGGKNAGYVQMVPLSSEAWEIGYHIAEKYTGRGYAAEAVRAFLPEMAGKLGIREVQGICLSENAASKRVLEKCGFEPVFEGEGDYQGRKQKIFKSVWRSR